jgi:VanZ family protein
VNARNWLPLLVWVVITHLFSTDSFSANESSRIIVPVLRFLFPDMSMAGIEILHAVIRKAGHVSEYFIMGLLAYRVFRRGSATVAFVLVAAVLNEAHQLLLTTERTGSVVDVGYDVVGGILAVSAVSLWMKFSRPRLSASE